MELSLNSLDKAGAFTGAPVKRSITWKDSGGKEIAMDVYVLRMSYRTAVSDLSSVTGKKDPVAGRIAACITNAKGQPVFTPEDITGEADPSRGPLDGNLTVALLQAIGEVNNLGKGTGPAS